MNTRQSPSIFAVAVVFGGAVGMTAASLFGLDAGGGFIVGAAFLFVALALGHFVSRDINNLTRAVERASANVSPKTTSMLRTAQHGD